MSVLTGFNSGLSALLTNLGMWIIVFLAIPLISDYQIDGVYLASLALITIAAFEAVTPLPQAAQMLGVSNAAARRLFGVVDADPKVKDPLIAFPAPATGEVQFNNVTFRYSPLDADALSDVSFSLGIGRRVSVVGPSGAGKSTIINLLMRFWNSPAGILIDGHPINTYTSDDVRKLMTVVSQSAYFFNATIKQNLLLANPRAKMDEIEAACRQAQIHDFIASLPQGYETWIGEQGTRLSGGERQRLAIARALLKDAPILLLDEPTANLDPLTEKNLLETLWEVMKRRTTLMITHRLVGLDRFDEVLVLDQGTIIERGTHSSLLKQGGLYRRMWDIQNRILLADV
jgi:ATP-binding cassette subfamily C protein CydC